MMLLILLLLVMMFNADEADIAHNVIAKKFIAQ